MAWSPIANPPTGLDTLNSGMSDIFNQMRANRLAPYQLALMKAQSQQAQAQAAKSQMLANLFQKVMGGNLGGSQNAAAPNVNGLPSAPQPSTGMPTTNAMSADEINGVPGSSVNPNTSSSGNMAVSGNDAGGNLAASALGMKMIPFSKDGKSGFINPLTGKVTYAQVGQTPEQESSLKSKTEKETMQGKSDVKASQLLIDAGRNLNTTAQHVNQLNDILDQNPDLTGGLNKIPFIGSSIGAATSKNPEALASFNTIGGDLATDWAHQNSTRGGVGITKMATTYKTDPSFSESWNRGVLQAHAKKVAEQYNALRDEYEQKNPGKQYPIAPPDVSRVLKKRPGYKMEFADAPSSSTNSSGGNVSVPPKLPNGVEGTPVDMIGTGDDTGKAARDAAGRGTVTPAVTSTGSTKAPIIVMYKGKQEYHFPAKYANSPKLKGYTLEPE